MKRKQWRLQRSLQRVGAIASTSGLATLVLSSPKVVAQSHEPITVAQAQPQRETALEALKRRFPWLNTPPRSQRPNKTRAGGSLNESCSPSGQVLSALVPRENPVMTHREHPQIWVYIPYGNEQIASAEFGINIGVDEKERLYQSIVTLPQTPGFVSLTVPETVELNPGTAYRWHFTLECEGSVSGVQANVNGGLERLGAEKAGSDGTALAWYDEVADAAEQMMLQPQSEVVRDRWLSLLEELNLTDLADEPLRGQSLRATQAE